MTPPRSDKVGVAPDVAMAMIESDVHHLREQSDMDRRSFARRLREDGERLERIERAQSAQAVQLARAADSTARLERIAEAHGATQARTLEIVYGYRGGLRLIKFLLGGGIAFELVRLYMEHLR